MPKSKRSHWIGPLLALLSSTSLLLGRLLPQRDGRDRGVRQEGLAVVNEGFGGTVQGHSCYERFTNTSTRNIDSKPMSSLVTV